MRKGSNNLAYPIDERPQPAETTRVAPGVYWVRMPLPISLGHINLWLLDDGDGWTIVDTGMATDDIRNLWEQIFELRLDSRPVTRLIVTHTHLDHVGLAGWLVDKLGVDLWMSRTEYLTTRVVAAEIENEAPPETIEFFRTAGFSVNALEVFRHRFRARSAFVSPLPAAYQRLADGQSIDAAGQEWAVVVGEGHSPEHVCLYCENLDVIIAGDQILPRISPNVGVRPNEPEANPLDDWLRSCRAFRDKLTEGVLVLPSHGDPFHGAHHRLDAMIQEHEINLERLHEFCAEPKRATDVFPALFKGEISDHNLVIATGEAQAHLNYLLAKGELVMEPDSTGVKWYRPA